MRILLILTLAYNIAIGRASLTRKMVVHERRDSTPAGFTRVGPAPDDQVLSLRLGIVQGDMAGLEARLLSTSSPSSSHYGRWLSKDEVETFVTPQPDTASVVKAFLAESNVTYKTLTPAGDALQISVSVAQANKLFDTRFEVFKSAQSGSSLIRTLEYSIPASLQGHLDFVHPTTVFAPVFESRTMSTGPVSEQMASRWMKARHVGRAGASCQTAITPSCAQALYNLPNTWVSPPENYSLGVAGYISGTSPTDVADEASLQLFLETEERNLPFLPTFSVQSLDGQHSSQSSIPANLAVQWTVGLAAFTPVVQYSVGNNYQDSLFGYLDLADHILAQQTPPNVFIASLGDSLIEERDVSTPLYQSLCNAYMQLGARGVSVIASAGDGSYQTLGGFNSPSCMPLFPASCPYVTSVGATTGIPETGAPFSSGGFSNIFAQPAFAENIVQNYVTAQAEIGAFPFGAVNPNGRAYPDVATVGGNVLAIWGDQGWLVDGVAASTSIFASIVALLNAKLAGAGKPALGYLNPFLYTTGASAFTDITTGSYKFSACSVSGFSATKGWDPVTGLGTPNFTALLAAAGV